MGRFDWGVEGPPDEVYSRVTEPERFRRLHDWAHETVARLQAEYEVVLHEGEEVDTELERVPLAGQTMKLTPPQDSCAPITIVFTNFPGLGVRVGRWVTDWFPSCGCDACDEMPEGEFERFTELLSCVVAGQFRESMSLQPGGYGLSNAEFWSDRHRGSRGSRVPRNEASEILKGEAEIVQEWTPWQLKPNDAATR